MAVVDQAKMDRKVPCSCEFHKSIKGVEPMAEGVQILMNRNGHGRITVDGHDVSGYVVSLQMSAGIGELTTVKLEMSAPVSVFAEGKVLTSYPERFSG